MGDTHLIEDEALALTGSTADGDDANGALDELEGGDGLRVHPELALFIAVYEADGPTEPGGSGRETRARVPRVGCWRWLLLRRRRRGGGRRSPAETEQLHHLSSLASTALSLSLSFLRDEEDGESRVRITSIRISQRRVSSKRRTGL